MVRITLGHLGLKVHDAGEMDVSTLNKYLGNMDLHLLDQVLKGKFQLGKLLDVGCGEGRNLHWFLHQKMDVYIADPNPSAIKMVRMVANSLQHPLPDDHTFAGDILEVPWDGFETILCINVLQHVMASKLDFIVEKMFKMLNSGGKLFLKVAINDAPDQQGLSVEDLEKALEKVGFVGAGNLRIDQIRQEGTWATGLLIRP